ncbi:MAG: nodulation protein NfeD [Deltaproteobacteria bacterium]|nr:nodulation protein NfeD [Deltaproteobacteria bacterium]
MRRRLLTAFLISAPFVAAPALAQLPDFFGGDEEEPQKKKKKKESADEPTAPEPKTYAKPEAVVLPAGEAELLRGPIALVVFKGIVNPGLGEHVITAIQRAEADRAQAVLIELDTPGGLVSTTQNMVEAILASKVPIIVYVSPSGGHAASAGTLITLAGHVAAMAPATRIGAAHPVTGGGKDPEEEGGKHMGRKVENDLAAYAETIAKERGKNVEWAVDAVRSSVSITEDKALEIGVIDLIAHDKAELLEKIDGRELMVGKKKVKLATKGAQIIEYQPSLRERLVNLLANPGIAMILGVLGMIGILVEVYHPGMIAPGVMGVLCIICSLIAMEQLPIDIGGAILVIGGIGLLVAEIYTSTYGALGVLGGLGLTVGLLLVFDPSDPDFAIDSSFRLTLVEVLPLVAILGLVIGYISYAVMGSRRAPAVTGRESLIGSIGFVLKPVDASAGMVFVQGEYWKARAKEPIGEKEEIEVIGIDGLTLDVRRRTSVPTATPTG